MTAVLDSLEASGSTFVLRRARRDDVDAIIALMADDALRAAEYAAAEAARAGSLRAFDAIDRDASQLLVVVEGPAPAGETTTRAGEAPGAAIVGTMQLTVIPGLSRGGASRLQIEGVRVADGLRGAGIGSAMIRWAIEHGREQGVRLVQLTSDASREQAHRFYERLGFEASHIGFKLRV